MRWEPVPVPVPLLTPADVAVICTGISYAPIDCPVPVEYWYACAGDIRKVICVFCPVANGIDGTNALLVESPAMAIDCTAAEL